MCVCLFVRDQDFYSRNVFDLHPSSKIIIFQISIALIYVYSGWRFSLYFHKFSDYLIVTAGINIVLQTLHANFKSTY